MLILVSPTSRFPGILTIGYVTVGDTLPPTAVKIVPCAGVLNVSVPEASAKISYVSVPPII